LSISSMSTSGLLLPVLFRHCTILPGMAPTYVRLQTAGMQHGSMLVNSPLCYTHHHSKHLNALLTVAVPLWNTTQHPPPIKVTDTAYALLSFAYLAAMPVGSWHDNICV
jgi:hypothetical protein